MKEICFCAFVSDEYYHTMGASKLVKSAAHFHPDIPMYVFGDKEIKEWDTPLLLLHPLVISKLINNYKKVVYFDADSMIVGRLDEIINAQGYDIIGVRNNNDFDQAGMDNPITQYGVGIDDYLNAGLVATTNKQFVEEWKDDVLDYGGLMPFGAQTILNQLRRKYKTLVLDPKESNVYYGLSSLSGEETHWDSWKQIEIEDEKFMLNGKQIKVLHHAGGFKQDKLGYYMFSEAARNQLIKILEK